VTMKRLIVLPVLATVLLASCVGIEDTVKADPRTNVSYEALDGTRIDSYMAMPDGDGPHPAVIMIHEWWGLNEDITILADALAEEGFVVLAADAYRGELGTSVAQALSLTRNTPVEQIRGDLDAALAFLRAQDSVDPNRIGSMGFCFGGRESMYLGIRADGLAAVVTLYGSGLVTDPAEMGNLAANGPVLGIFGEKDNSIPLDEVQEFSDALDAIGAERTISIYPDMGHAFVKSSTYQDGAAGEAWDELVAFFRANL
jgi:carboxymethylenebutenolidase